MLGLFRRLVHWICSCLCHFNSPWTYIHTSISALRAHRMRIFMSVLLIGHSHSDELKIVNKLIFPSIENGGRAVFKITIIIFFIIII